MSLQALVDKKIVGKFKGVSLKQIGRRLGLAFAHLNSAIDMFKKKRTKDANENTIVYKNTYDAMRIAAEAYLLLKGCKAVKKDHHKMVIKAVKDLMRKEGLDTVFIRWDKMRKTRNAIDYDIDIMDVSKQSIEQSIMDAKKLLRVIELHVEKKNPQAKIRL